VTVTLLKDFLLWCVVINYGVLLVWFAVWVFGRDAIYHLHSRWFDLPRDRFDTLFYGLMGGYKLVVLVFFLVPWLALCLIA